MEMTLRTQTRHVLGVSLLAAAVPAAGQLPEEVIGMDMTVTRPLGEFSEHAGVGWGIDGHLAFGGVLAARFDYGLVLQGHQSTLRCFDPGTVICDPFVDVSTLQTVLHATIGPQLAVEVAGVIPYLQSGVGVSYFRTGSEVADAYSRQLLAAVTNQGRANVLWASGGGVMVPLEFNGNSSLMLDLGVRYHRNGNAEFLRIEDIELRADGTARGVAIRSRADYLSFRVGVAVGWF